MRILSEANLASTSPTTLLRQLTDEFSGSLSISFLAFLLRLLRQIAVQGRIIEVVAISFDVPALHVVH